MEKMKTSLDKNRKINSKQRQTTVALVGNPNCGKTTMFNDMTGSNQRVGNWPGVTVEKKEGTLKSNPNIEVADLPGIYSLSPYTLEEVVSRDYLLTEKPEAILNLLDATNLERNLYLTTQILELGIPTVVALNMMDLVKKSGDKIDGNKLSRFLGCPVTETSALRNDGVIAAAEKAAEISGQAFTGKMIPYSPPVEEALQVIREVMASKVEVQYLRWYTVKLFERDEKVLAEVSLSDRERKTIEQAIASVEQALEDESDGIIINQRYDYIAGIVKQCLVKGQKGLTISNKIDLVVTNRMLALPIFIAAMFLVYFISMTWVGAIATDWTNNVLFGEILIPGAEWLLTKAGVADWLVGLAVDGVIGGVGSVLGFVPQMLVLFFLLILLEDCGYMARIAFIMDRLFRKFGLSGKSFIPMLISTGCGVPGIMASKTIENEKDRRMTVMTTTFMPCSAKLPIVALIAGALFGGAWWVAPSAYFLGVASIILSGLMLKKTKLFRGDLAPFVMELPAYHAPKISNVLHETWERGWGFIKRASTVILVASVVIWFAGSYGWANGVIGRAEDMDVSFLGIVGNAIRGVFVPLGFGFAWQPVVASLLGLIAKEEVVGAMGTMAAVAGDALTMVQEGSFGGMRGVAAFFASPLAAYSFLVFNLLCAPCVAAMGAIRREMNSAKWTGFAIGYQCVFAYGISLMIYQFGCLFTGGGFSAGTVFALGVLGLLVYLLVRPDPNRKKKQKNLGKVTTVSLR